ncbi:ethanolamine ammonia-lyase subunit EutC [Sphingomonas glacialis]|uniref:Ethanolamine ammonia-lyase small subunit n=1 Tax=Sphingomonas glacialis TaxID=658225 RepID=A0A502FAY6_9SPHN|nr:ethanolamine ammonia-lyase subunit EutC [Sphingomonas glacialis]TPG46459.1 ethanolamine ammonia-lyase subunit EutC [Sphingomonas glacialis]
MADPPELDRFARLRPLTSARIGLGRAGQALPTAPMLDFQLAHARARDAVHTALDVALLRDQLGCDAILVGSAAPDRATYLQNPGLGRRVEHGAEALVKGRYDLAIVIGDGLSATAVHAHAATVTAALIAALKDWTIAPIVLATQARVALGDDVAARFGARALVMLIGERPGLSAADSLGAYITWKPVVGRRDSQRNCVSNIRTPGGFAPTAAAAKIAWLLGEARKLGLTGVSLKDRQGLALPSSDTALEHD